jgi:RNA recognition motif-containing protein
MNNRLFVGNLSYRTTESQLIDAFTAHGVVVEANVPLDRATGRPRGFAFVTMSTEEEAQAAIEAMNGATVDERELTVNIARPREERPRRDFGGGGGGGRRGGGRDRGDRRERW